MTAYADLFAVRDPAFESSGAVRFANEFARVRVVSNLVVHFGTRQTAGFRACANRDRLHCRYRHDSLCEQSIEFEIPGRVRTESRYDAAHRNFKDTAKGVAFLSYFIDQHDHSLFRLAIGTVERRIVRNGRNLFPIQLQWQIRNAAELDHVTANLDAKDGEQLFCECATRD